MLIRAVFFEDICILSSFFISRYRYCCPETTKNNRCNYHKTPDDVAAHLRSAHGTDAADYIRCDACGALFKTAKSCKVHGLSFHPHLVASEPVESGAPKTKKVERVSARSSLKKLANGDASVVVVNENGHGAAEDVVNGDDDNDFDEFSELMPSALTMD